MNIDCIIVGAGLSGAVLAERLANCARKKVLVIEKNPYIGGTCYDCYDSAGILIHKYGPHIFNTSSEEVWQYIQQFSDFHIYHHRVLGVIDGKKVPIPFNLESLHQVFPEYLALELEKKLINNYGYNKKVPIMELQKQEDTSLKYLADYIYEKVFLHYTEKQWGMTPDEVGGAAMARIPVFISRDDRYFQNKYQGIPVNGYSAMIKNMLNNPHIKLLLNTDYKEVLAYFPETCSFHFMGREFNGTVIFTAQLDMLFNYKFGELPYRTLKFQFETYNQEHFQELCTINYPNNYEFTRITEFKYMTGQQSKLTTIVKEFPLQYNRNDIHAEPYYPIPKPENLALYQKYRALAQSCPNLILAGRLADYSYYTMSDTIANALKVYQSLKIE